MSEAPPTSRHFTASAVVTHRGRALLLLHSGKELWLPPGGHVEPDEAPDAAAVREVWEETGLRVQITSACVPSDSPLAAPRPEAALEVEVAPGHVHIDLVYFARPLDASGPGPLRPNDEARALRWWSVEELGEGDPALPPDVVALALAALAADAAP